MNDHTESSLDILMRRVLTPAQLANTSGMTESQKLNLLESMILRLKGKIGLSTDYDPFPLRAFR